jgi:hypothetical protein
LRIATIAELAGAIGVALPEAGVLPLRAGRTGAIAAGSAALDRALAEFDAVLIGPGMPAGPVTARLLARVMRLARGAIVIDAGALAARTPRRAARRPWPILTPHASEAAKLLGCRDADDLRDAARDGRNTLSLRRGVQRPGDVDRRPGRRELAQLARQRGARGVGLGRRARGAHRGHRRARRGTRAGRRVGRVRACAGGRAARAPAGPARLPRERARGRGARDHRRVRGRARSRMPAAE